MYNRNAHFIGISTSHVCSNVVTITDLKIEKVSHTNYAFLCTVPCKVIVFSSCRSVHTSPAVEKSNVDSLRAEAALCHPYRFLTYIQILTIILIINEFPGHTEIHHPTTHYIK